MLTGDDILKKALVNGPHMSVDKYMETFSEAASLPLEEGLYVAYVLIQIGLWHEQLDAASAKEVRRRAIEAFTKSALIGQLKDYPLYEMSRIGSLPVLFQKFVERFEKIRP